MIRLTEIALFERKKEMNREKEIQKMAKVLERMKVSSSENPVWHQIAAGYLFAAGHCDIDDFAQKIFDKTEKYIDKWYSRAEEEKDEEYAWGMRYACSTAKSRLDDIKKEYEDEKILEAFFDRKTEEKEKVFKKMVKIIHSCLCSSELPEDSICPECEEVAKKLLSAGYDNRFLFLSSFFSKVRKYMEEEKERTKAQIPDDKDDAQYVVGKMFIFGRFERKIEKLEKEWEEKRMSAEMLLEQDLKDPELIEKIRKMEEDDDV